MLWKQHPTIVKCINLIMPWSQSFSAIGTVTVNLKSAVVWTYGLRDIGFNAFAMYSATFSFRLPCNQISLPGFSKTNLKAFRCNRHLTYFDCYHNKVKRKLMPSTGDFFYMYFYITGIVTQMSCKFRGGSWCMFAKRTRCIISGLVKCNDTPLWNKMQVIYGHRCLHCFAFDIKVILLTYCNIDGDRFHSFVTQEMGSCVLIDLYISVNVTSCQHEWTGLPFQLVHVLSWDVYDQ